MNNVDRWNAAKFTRSTPIEAQAAKIRASRSRYEAVAAKTGVPWDVIAVIHYRESSGSFAGVLHNGQKIIGTGKKTTLVPKGRGPFSTWEQAAIDALMNCHPYAGQNKDWSLAGTLDILERYNGLGYRKKGLPSPYLWAGTDQYVKGKYVADGKYDPNHVDQQLGVAALLIALRGKGGDVPKTAKPGAQRKPVPPKTGARPAPMTPPVVPDEKFYRRIQTQLRDLGYSEVGEIDGKPGKLFATAVRAFRAENGLPDGDHVDDAFLLALQKAPQRKLSAERETAPTEKVADRAPEVAANWRTEVQAKYGFVGIIVVYVFDWIARQFAAGEEAIDRVISLVSSVPPTVWFALAALVMGYLWFNHWSGRVAGVLAWRTGARR